MKCADAPLRGHRGRPVPCVTEREPGTYLKSPGRSRALLLGRLMLFAYASSGDGVKLDLRDSCCEVDPVEPLDAHGLKREAVVGAAEEHVSSEATAPSDLRGHAAVLTGEIA